MPKGTQGFIKKWRHPTTTAGKGEKLYVCWYHMLSRCKGRFRHRDIPTYLGCSYAPEWESYDNFADWASQQVGALAKDESGRHFHLDKDILVKGNKTYSPETCVFVPQTLNTFLTLRQRCRGKYPLGVYFKKKNSQFCAQIALDTGQQKYLGLFPTAELAFQAYKVEKEQRARELARIYRGKVDERVIQRLETFEVSIED